jgi:hypothetical protein
MTISMTAKFPAIAPGDADDVTVVIGNTAIQGTSDAVVTIHLPPTMTLVGPPAVDRGRGCSGAATITCDLDFFPAALTLPIRFSVRASAVGKQELTAEVVPAESDADATDNHVSLSIDVITPAVPPQASPAQPKPASPKSKPKPHSKPKKKPAPKAKPHR